MTTLDDSPVRTGGSAPPADDGGDWRHRAACRDEDPEDWFPVSESELQVAYPRDVCATVCPVQAACLTWALAANQGHGVWGGSTARERELLKKRGSRPGSSVSAWVARFVAEGPDCLRDRRTAAASAPDGVPGAVKAPRALLGHGELTAVVGADSRPGDEMRARVLGMLADGLSSREVAARLGVSEDVARQAARVLFRVLDVEGPEQAVAEGHRSGILAGRSRVADPGLSTMDVRVLRWVALGWSARMVSDELGLPIDPARRRVSDVLRLFGVPTRAAAVDAGFRCGVLPVVGGAPVASNVGVS